MTDDDDLDELIYTAKDIEIGLSHLAHWYESTRSGDQDVLLDPARTEQSLSVLHYARAVMRLNGCDAGEFSRREALAMYMRLMRKRRRLGDALVIRPKRLVAAMRALKSRTVVKLGS